MSASAEKKREKARRNAGRGGAIRADGLLVAGAYAVVRTRDFLRQHAAVSARAHRCQTSRPAARRIGGRVDRVPRLLPVRAVARLLRRASAGHTHEAAHAGSGVRRAARAIGRATRARRRSYLVGQRRSTDRQRVVVALGPHRPAVRHAFGDESAPSSVVRALDAARTGRRVRLFAISNFGSIVALLAYPWLIEPRLTLRAQTIVVAIVLGLLAILAGVLGAPCETPRTTGTRRQAESAGVPATPACSGSRWRRVRRCSSRQRRRTSARTSSPSRSSGSFRS